VRHRFLDGTAQAGRIGAGRLGRRSVAQLHVGQPGPLERVEVGRHAPGPGQVQGVDQDAVVRPGRLEQVERLRRPARSGENPRSTTHRTP
jgi:hypothetical protein